MVNNILIMSRFIILSSALLILTSASMEKPKHKPTIFIIGDSTVKNGSGKGDGGPVNDNSRARGTIRGAVAEGIRSLKGCRLSKYLNKR
jgi:hypothetical protein